MFTYCPIYVEVITKSLVLKIFSFVKLASKNTGGEQKGCTSVTLYTSIIFSL